ncbi:MAG: hypothetical protein E7Z91_03405 [Cyanobacteria bacterium SIG30]|nr:hypothetical protein [Cyanobacteria bacterium SIG30]
MSRLSLNYTGIGSIPFADDNAPSKAVDFVFENFKEIPFWPQLPHFAREEDMVLQFSEAMAGLTIQDGKIFFDTDSETFYEKLEELFFDFEEIMASDNLLDVEEQLDKYKIQAPYSNAIGLFLNKLKDFDTPYVKGSITGAFTFSTSVNDNQGKSAFYDETLREVIVKTLILKALWQIKEFNKISPNATPIIFMDEPSVSQIGSCAFLTVKNEEVVEMLATISNAIKKFNAISGIHCCGKTDWEIAMNADVNVINFDAYSYMQSVSLFAPRVKKYIEDGNYLAFGIVPTLDADALNKLDIENLKLTFENAVEFLVKKGISKDLILKQSFVTPSCGCGSLTIDEAIKALSLTRDLSVSLRGVL